MGFLVLCLTRGRSLTLKCHLKMAEASLNDLLPEVPYDPPESIVK